MPWKECGIIRNMRPCRSRPPLPVVHPSAARIDPPVTTTKKAYYDDDPYNARDFNDPEDFYDYYYDDFEDYEEAYDYFYEHNPD